MFLGLAPIRWGIMTLMEDGFRISPSILYIPSRRLLTEYIF
jgi:hypothetical protein